MVRAGERATVDTDENVRLLECEAGRDRESQSVDCKAAGARVSESKWWEEEEEEEEEDEEEEGRGGGGRGGGGVSLHASNLGCEAKRGRTQESGARKGVRSVVLLSVSRRPATEKSEGRREGGREGEYV